MLETRGPRPPIQKAYELRGPQGHLIMRHFSLDRVLDAAILLATKNKGKTFIVK